mmetsp:Transcript_19429/g.45967  ORF Transcript_19429/g.45967 Transcript_19429/m.45967 type:complete len:229 (+) Transcript_19429:61-747(+)
MFRSDDVLLLLVPLRRHGRNHLIPIAIVGNGRRLRAKGGSSSSLRWSTAVAARCRNDGRGCRRRCWSRDRRSTNGVGPSTPRSQVQRSRFAIGSCQWSMMMMMIKKHAFQGVVLMLLLMIVLLLLIIIIVVILCCKSVEARSPAFVHNDFQLFNRLLSRIPHTILLYLLLIVVFLLVALCVGAPTMNCLRKARWFWSPFRASLFLVGALIFRTLLLILMPCGIQTPAA